jgi:aspartyl-tRNA(Asn)/glutamyl-tRNA(Gln) amidotransferase subunit A
MIEPSDLSAAALLEGFLRRDFSPVEVIEVLAQRIEQLDLMLGAISALCLDRARNEAMAHEQAYLRDEQSGSLAGVPFSVKDLFGSEGVRTA